MNKEVSYDGYLIDFRVPFFNELDRDDQEELLVSFADTHYWFEVVLFELLDEDQDGIPEATQGREFLIGLGEPVRGRAVNEDDYLGKKEALGDVISKGSVMIGETLYPRIILRRK